MFFIILFTLFIVLDVWWWRWADAQLRPLTRPRLWRSLLATWMTALMLYMLAFVIFPRQARAAHQWLSVWYLALAYVWHLLILPVTLLAFIPGRIVGSLVRWWKRRRHQPVVSSEE